MLLLPLTFILALAGLAFLPSGLQSANVTWAFLGAAAALFVWVAVLNHTVLRDGRTLTIDVALRKQHYVQACAQGSVLLYWGWHWPQVYAMAPLILAQLVFAFAFEMLLVW